MSYRMNRSQLVAAVSARLRLRNAVVRRVVDAVLEEIAQTLEAGGEARLSGFGTFLVRVRGARPGRNLRSGEFLMQRELRVPAFRSSDQLRARIDRGRSTLGDAGS